MANWPALVVILVVTAGGAAAGAFVFLAARQVLRRVRSRRAIATATLAHREVTLPPFRAPAHLSLVAPLVHAAAPSQLIAPAAPGRHSYEHLKLDPPTERLIVVPGPASPVRPSHSVRGHRATQARPAGARLTAGR